MPSAGLDPVSQPAVLSGAHPVPRVSFRDCALLCRHLHMVFTGDVPAPISPVLVSPVGGAGGPQSVCLRLHPGTHLNRSISPRLQRLVADGGPSIAGSRRWPRW